VESAPTAPDPTFELSPYLVMLIDRLASIPVADKLFNADSEWAASHLSMGDEVFGELVRAGIPAVRSGDRTLLDSRDLMSVSYAYNPASANRRSAQLWTRQLRNLHAAPAGHEIRYVVNCPAPGHHGGCEWRYSAPDAPPGPASAEGYRLSAGPPGPAVTAPAQVRAILDRYADVSFHILPGAMMADPDVVRRQRVAECDTMARTVVEDAWRDGVEARTAFGLIVARPYSSTHSWAEFRIGGAWVPYDAFLIRTMQGWNIPKARSLDPHMSLNGFFLRLAAARGPLVTHGGEAVQPALPTSRVPMSADVGT
jgi:hypothetical protein